MQVYDQALASGKLESDAVQRAVAQKLEALAEAMQQGALLKILSKAAPRGLYIYGPVGRGKTMLMDMFFESLQLKKKRRAHFHAFMRDVHERIFRQRQQSEGDVLLEVADAIADETHVLCFDELAVTDIADAAILSRLFKQLFEKNVTVVCTSNLAPEELYKGGLNRPLFEPFIELIREKMDVIKLDAKKDFRLEKLEKSGVYFTGAGAEQKFEAAWRALIQEQPVREKELHFKGRSLPVPAEAAGACRFTYPELCEAPLSAEDYLELAAEYHTLFLQGVPRFRLEDRNALRRFINLIDILYDHGVNLIVSAAAEPGDLVEAMDGYESQAYQRAASRLIEMRSKTYLARRHLTDSLESGSRSG